MGKLPEHSRNLRPHHEKMYCEQRTSSSPKEKQLLDFISPLILIFNSHTVVSAVLKDGISGARGLQFATSLSQHDHNIPQKPGSALGPLVRR